MRTLDELGISPAPWRYENRGAVAYDLADVKCAWRGLARARNCTMVVHNAWDADARLIAAAPRLYEALRGLLNFMPLVALKDSDIGKAMEAAKAALAAAGGESEEGEMK